MIYTNRPRTARVRNRVRRVGMKTAEEYLEFSRETTDNMELATLYVLRSIATSLIAHTALLERCAKAETPKGGPLAPTE